MAIIIKTDSQVEKMRAAGRVVALAHEAVTKYIRVGVTTAELNAIVEDFILSHNAKPSFKGYNGFPAAINASVNEEIIHGIPGLRKLNDGDIISIDIGAFKDGFHGDAARTHGVGKISDEAQQLIDATRQSFFEGIKFAKADAHLYDISAAIDSYTSARGYSLVRDYCGHGIGRNLHEDPQVPNYKQAKRGPRLYKNITLAIEPMVNMGTHEIVVLGDNWTVITKDKKLSAHYENTILVTDGEPELLTL